MRVTEEMVSRFLSWPLPKSVRPDACVMDQNYPHRVGTNLLTADEARQMLEYVLATAEVIPGRYVGLVEHVPPYPSMGSMGGGSATEARAQDDWERRYGPPPGEPGSRFVRMEDGTLRAKPAVG